MAWGEGGGRFDPGGQGILLQGGFKICGLLEWQNPAS